MSNLPTNYFPEPMTFLEFCTSHAPLTSRSRYLLKSFLKEMREHHEEDFYDHCRQHGLQADWMDNVVMERYEIIAQEMLSFITTAQNLADQDLPCSKSRFILCGISGSGKTRAVHKANESLCKGQEIAESQDLLYIDDIDEALNIFFDKELAYVNSKFIGFNIINKKIAKELHRMGIKVFWM